MKHFKATEPTDPNVCDTTSRELADTSSDSPVTLIDSRTVLVRSPDRTVAPIPGEEGSVPTDDMVVIRAADSCIEVLQLGAREFEIGLRDCEDGAGYNFNSGDIVVSNGFVKKFAQPVMRVTSGDNSLRVTSQNGAVDIRVSPESFVATALPSRVLCASGSCPDAGRAIGVVQVVRLESGDYQLQGCALAGEGAGAAALSFSSDTYELLNDAVSAMNAATLTAVFGSCGGGGL